MKHSIGGGLGRGRGQFWYIFFLSFVNRGWWWWGLTFLCRLLQIRKELPRKRLKGMRGRGRLGRKRERCRGRGDGGGVVSFLSLGGGCILVFFSLWLVYI